jgi:hypothetical protein
MFKKSATLAIATIAMGVFMCRSSLLAQVSAPAHSEQPSTAAQSGLPQQTCDDRWKTEKWNTPNPCRNFYETLKSGPAPQRDISGIWDGGTEGGVQPNGAYEFPDDPDHVGQDPPYTALGREALAKTKPGEGERQVPVAEVNDPVDYCDPQGMPRDDLYEFRTVQLIETKNQMVILNQFNRVWRIVWKDGRELPKDPAPRWQGYSVGKWVDDYTFVADYVGMDLTTWIDNVGRPHSADLHVQERWHRVNADILELTVIIDDPKYYTKPWKALDRHVLHRLSDDHDMYQFACSVSETQEYNKLIGAPAAIPMPADLKK